MCGIAFIRRCFFLRSGFAFTDLHSFPLLLCPSLFASQKHPGRSLHPLICSIHFKCVFLLSFMVPFIPHFCHLLFWPPCSPKFIKKLPPLSISPSNCPALLHACFPLCCSLSSHFSAPMRHHLVFEITANEVRCWFHPGFNPKPMNLICFSRKLELRAETAKLIL